jgi:hypothetical protein
MMFDSLLDIRTLLRESVCNVPSTFPKVRKRIVQLFVTHQQWFTELAIILLSTRELYVTLVIVWREISFPIDDLCHWIVA